MQGRGVGAGERVDRLRDVTDDAEIGAIAEPGSQQAELEGRRVLELVDEQVPEPPALAGRERRVALDRVGTPAEQVVEVAAPPLALLGFVPAVEVGDLARRRDGVPAGRDRGGGVPLRGVAMRALAHSISAARSLTSAARPGPVFPRSGDRRRALDASTVGASRPCSSARRRSCASASAWNVPAVTPLDPQRTQPFDELAGGFARERDGEHVTGLGFAAPRPPRDAARQDARLARAGGREDREWLCVGGDGFALARVEAVEEKVHAGATVAKGCATWREAGRVESVLRRRGRPRVVFAACAAPNSSGPIPDRHCDREHALAGAPDTHCRRHAFTPEGDSTSGPLCARSVCASFPLSGGTPCDVPLDFFWMLARSPTHRRPGRGDSTTAPARGQGELCVRSDMRVRRDVRVQRVHVSRRRFEALVAEALDDLPEALLAHSENVVVLVEDSRPGTTCSADDVEGDTLFGLYEGVAQTDRGIDAPFLPDRITLFRDAAGGRLRRRGRTLSTRSTSRWCTNSRTISASTTTASTSSAGPDALGRRFVDVS